MFLHTLNVFNLKLISLRLNTNKQTSVLACDLFQMLSLTDKVRCHKTNYCGAW